MEKRKKIVPNRRERVEEASPKTAPRTEKQPGRREWSECNEHNALPEDVVVGRNAVTEALKSGRAINRLLVAEGDGQGSIREIVRVARDGGALVETVARSKIEAIARGFRHQGVLAYVSPVDYTPLDDIFEAARQKSGAPFLLLLDELEDPHNLGAILRTADAVGVDGVLIPRRRSCPLSATVAKTSAGAVEYVPVARIGNVAQTIRELKDEGFWIVGADMDGTADYFDADLTGATVLVVGNEGKGISRLVRESCDVLVKIPMLGKINSLNVSVAGAVLMYEALRQRRRKGGL
ncbi:MAG: 23S rRNA (guanosine(2251)-2'-O)-methyltransferase RlmB [Schwartzia sp.]|nr:23S rRNA (guanosine(2251)-2'-O)-methyltransferase RlmB [Schwartzia sp. (in: firmicutes)]